jgi:hypothetical protein
MNDRSLQAEPGFDSRAAGRRAECDGGGPVAGTRYAGRQEFTGTLTGAYVDHGQPPWRWYLLAQLTRKPEGYPDDAVWCESESLFPLDGEPPIRPSRRGER